MPRKKKNEQVVEKIKSFVETANEREAESSEDEYNIYVESAKKANGTTPPLPTPSVGTSVKPKKQYTKRPKTTPTETVPADPNERLYKMFDDYKSELSELKSIVTGRNNGVPQGVPQGVVPQGVVPHGVVPPSNVPQSSSIDLRRQMMQLRFN
jgi:hypothetical protein